MKTRVTKIKFIVATCLLMLLLSGGCIKEEFDPEKFDASLNLTPGLAIPVGFSHMGFEDYLAKTPYQDELHIDEDGLLSLYYSAPVDSGVMGDLLSISDASIDNSIFNTTGSVILLSIPGATFDLADSIIIPVTSPQISGRIDSITLSAGSLQLMITSANLTGTVTYHLPGLRQNGIPYSTTRSLADPDFTLALAGYSVIPDHDIAGNNLLKCIISVHLQTPSGPVNPGGTIMITEADLASVSYETLYGDFAGYTIEFPAQTIATPFFDKLTEGEIRFAEPKFKLRFLNSVGVPFGISFSEIYAIDRNNLHHPLTGPGIPSATTPKIIKYPSLSQSGQVISDSLVIDKGNSDLPDFIATNPDSVTIKGKASIASPAPSETTFIRYDSKYNVSAVFELPLWGRADFLILLDTMPFDYLSSALPPPEELEKVIVRTSITNSFPASAWPQIYLLDANYNMLDSLFTGTEKIEGAGDTNGDGKADPLKQSPIDINLPRSRIDNLLNTRYIIVKGRITTTDFPAIDVKLYSSYFLDYKVGLIAQLKINTGK
jgi:hypothetical protein